MTLTGAAVTRTDLTINFDWASGSPIGGVGADNFSVRWTGFLAVPTTGAYTFFTQSDDGVRFSIDCDNSGSFSGAEQIINNWTDHSSTENTGTCGSNLTAGVRYRIQMDFYENGGDAVARLSYSGPSVAKQVVPAWNGTFGLVTSDNTPPTISSVAAVCGYNNSITVVFSEPVTSATANNAANYQVDSGAVSVTAASLAADQMTVTLSTGVLSLASHTVQVSGVADLYTNVIVPGSSASFTYTGSSFQPGLSGVYYSQGGAAGAYFTGSTVSRIDPTVNFNWGNASPVAGIGADDFSVRWQGFVLAPTTGNYNFCTVSDDGVRLYVNSITAVNNWTDHGPTTDTSANIALTSGQYYPVTMEFYERGGGAVAQLLWRRPGDASCTAIPSANLFYCAPPTTTTPGGFNAYEPATAAGAITGAIKTKIAGSPFNLDLIALNTARTAIDTGFLSDVKVEFLDARDNSGALNATTGCRSTWTTVIQTTPTVTFTAANAGRKTNVSFLENNVWPDVRVRISYPATGSPTVTGCSTDNFAIRPNTFANVSVTDNDWQTAGAARTLNNTTSIGGFVHKAGRPFTLSATAVNAQATPATTTGYVGTPTATFSTCIGTACTPSFGILTLGAAAVAGVVNSATASYNEVGSFSMQLVDQTYANVDVADSTTAERYIASAATNVGRFVPDHYSVDLTAGNAPTLTTRSDLACAPISTFTYMDETFGLSYRIEARTYSAAANVDGTSGARTTLYNGASLAKGVVSVQAENSNNGTDLSTRLSVASGSWAAGVYAVNTSIAKFTRLATPDGPYDSLQMGVIVVDTDGPVLESLTMNPTTNTNCIMAVNCTGVALNTQPNPPPSMPTSMRFGRLRLSNANGSELLDLPVTLEAQYWNGSSFTRNTSDNCTAISAANVLLSGYVPASFNLKVPQGNISVSGPFLMGLSNLKLVKPLTPSIKGSVQLCVDLDGAVVRDASCQATTPANMPYLQGAWSAASTYTLDPKARATFGTYKGSSQFIYMRENY